MQDLAPKPAADALLRITARIGETAQQPRWRVRLARSAEFASPIRVGAVGLVVAAAVGIGVLIGQVRLPSTTSSSPSSLPSPTTPSPNPDRIVWQEPSSYSFVVEGCGPNDPVGTLRIVVTDGVATDVEALDARAEVYERGYPLDALPTLGFIVDRANEALRMTESWLSRMTPRPERSMSPPVVAVETSPVDGHPTFVSIDWLPEAIDDELCYRIRDFDRDGDATLRHEALGWVEPSRYEFVMRSSCGERNRLGTYRLKVVGGRVEKAERLDETARWDPIDVHDLPTLAVLLNRAAYALGGTYDPSFGRSESAAPSPPFVTIETDPTDGHPTLISIDWIPEAVDDEECYRIQDFETALIAGPLRPDRDPRDNPIDP
jgi:hypothetical protein